MNAEITVKFNALPQVAEVVHLGAKNAVLDGAIATVEDAKRQIAEQVGTGVQYSDLPNRSSAPEEAPVNQMGKLLESIHIATETDVIGICADAVSDSEYAPYLEFGTSRMAPRPFMGPAAVVGEEVAAESVETLAFQLRNLYVGRSI